MIRACRALRSTRFIMISLENNGELIFTRKDADDTAEMRQPHALFRVTKVRE
jgi:hypothetical protein